MTPLSLPYITGKEKEYINQVVESGNLSGNGYFTKKCHAFFEKKFGFKKALLTNSCTDALEMCALLIGAGPGDEIILPSYTFVSTATAFCNYGVTPVFCDSSPDNPNISVSSILSKITPKTKAIVVMHYGGILCEMDEIRKIARQHNIFIIEDAALALGSNMEGKYAGTLSDFAAFSFHETKNITCGEGGLLVINNEKFLDKAEIIWEKGTNRASFLRGESEKYEWISKGSSFLTSEIHAAFLYAQAEAFDTIQQLRIAQWNRYLTELMNKGNYILPNPHSISGINGSIFYLLVEKGHTEQFTQIMREEKITVSSHYRCLHNSPFIKSQFETENLINCEKIAETLIRLPLFPDLTEGEQSKIIEKTISYFND